MGQWRPARPGQWIVLVQERSSFIINKHALILNTNDSHFLVESGVRRGIEPAAYGLIHHRSLRVVRPNRYRCAPSLEYVRPNTVSVSHRLNDSLSMNCLNSS